MPSTTLPRGIRNNNPGNLRSAVGPDFKTSLLDGFAVFQSQLDGVTSLAYLVDQYYRVLRLNTIAKFVGRYAPATENDLYTYQQAVAHMLGFGPASWDQADLRLDLPWRAITMMRAIINIENGPCPMTYNGTDEWVLPSTLINAMDRTGKWVRL